MATRYSPKIITDGAVLYYDENNKNSTNKKDLILGRNAVLAASNYSYFVNDGLFGTTAASVAQYNSSAPSPGTGFSGNFWIRRTANTTGNWDTICYVDTGGPRYRQLWFGWYYNVTDQIHCSVPYYSAVDTTDWWSVDPAWSYVGLTFVVGQWYNFCFSYNNATRLHSTYINGMLAASGTRPGLGDMNNPNGSNIYIFGTSNQSYANGNLKSVIFYNRALTASEVMQNFVAVRNKYGY